jgi:hypothetical protein
LLRGVNAPLAARHLVVGGVTGAPLSCACHHFVITTNSLPGVVVAGVVVADGVDEAGVALNILPLLCW